MPTALVLGGTGFVGSHVVRTLLERCQYRVYCLCRRSQDDIPAGAMPVQGDIESVQALQTSIETTRADLVINLAGIYAWWVPDPSLFERVNVRGVANLIEAAKRCPQIKKVVHVSTVLAYGNPPGRGLSPETAFDEDTPAGPHSSLYASSKHGGDCIAHAAFSAGEVPGCSLFLACCIGADHKLTNPQKDVMRLVDLISGKVPATISSNTTFTYVHVRDAAEAIVRAAELAGNEKGGRYLVGNQRLQTAQFYDTIAAISGQPKPTREVPMWLALGAGKASSWWASRVSGRTPTAPADLVRTAVSGTLLFDASRSEAELSMKYTSIRDAFVEAIDFVTSHGLPDVPADQPEAARGLLGAED